MTAAAHLRKGWCPGALRPMRSGDGLLVRIRPRAGVFSLAALSTIASVASRFGSGEIDLTNRGNLQVRGVADETLDTLIAVLDDAGLLDPSVEAEAVRNVIVDPLSGLDPARADVRDLALALEDVLQRDVRLWSLPGKFGFSFSGVADFNVGGRSADVMVSTRDGRFMISLDGARDACCDAGHDDVIDVVHRLSLAFLGLSETDTSFRRMRDAVSRLGAGTLFALAGLGPARPSPKAAHGSTPVGLLERIGCVFGAGIGLPFGRIAARQLDMLCDAATAANAEEIYTSPERVVVVPISDAERGTDLLLSADAAGLITRADDLRLTMDVCPGSPGCKNASTDTRRDAQYFVDTFGGSLHGRSLHISGCEKGCARRGNASVTLVGRCGCYGVIKDGSADSAHVLETVAAKDIGAAISRLIVEPAA